MSFSQRYLRWLLIPPAVISLPIAALFVSQVVQLTGKSWLTLVVTLVVLYAVGAGIFHLWLQPLAAAVENALVSGRDPSRAMTACLQKTKLASLVLWVGGGFVFAILCTITIMPSFLGFGYFLVAAFISASFSTVWAYGAGKHLLHAETKKTVRIRWTGTELGLGRKLAIVFVGFFILSSIALIQLISSRVATALETLAISNSTSSFEKLFTNIDSTQQIELASIVGEKAQIPAEHELFLLTPGGRIIGNGELSPHEIAHMVKLKSGDSSSYVGPHVAIFRALHDGSILVLTIPWSPYRNIPRQVAFYAFVVALITTVIFAIAVYFFSREMTTQLDEVARVVAEMAKGNFVAEERIFSDDEIGRLANSVAETRGNLRRLIARIGGSGSTITDGVRVITGGTENLLNRSREQADLTTYSTSAVENVREGISALLNSSEKVADLTQDSSSRVLELQASAEEVDRSMDNLFQSVEKTSSSTTEMDASAREMSDRTDVLAGIGDEVLSFVSEMGATIEELRQNAEATAGISRQVREDAVAGGEAVNETVEGITDAQGMTMQAARVLDNLQKSVGKISQILNVIEEVTERTNLLALNAAIIAAQAGEHGVGFTVVADEIRDLAERTRGSTKEISGIIKAIQAGSKEAVNAMHDGVSRVNQNVDLARKAAESLEKIVTSTARSYEMANKISTALGDQATASRHLHGVTSRMSDHISEINRSTREQARGTQMLATEAERVREIASQVKSSTEQQSLAGRGISEAMEQIAGDTRTIRDLLQKQLRETDRIADASKMMLEIAQQNDGIAKEFNITVRNLVQSGQDFESEVGKFNVAAEG